MHGTEKQHMKLLEQARKPDKRKKSKPPAITITLGMADAAGDAFKRINKIRKAPQISFDFAMYLKNQLQPVLVIIAEYREVQLKKYGTPINDGLQYNLGGDNYKAYNQIFQIDYLGGETQLKPLPITLEELLASFSAPSKDSDNTISGEDILLVESFLAPG